jgi:hypothetical protein
VLANQKKILANQATIISNQKGIKANQSTILANQKKILAKQSRPLSVDVAPDHGGGHDLDRDHHLSGPLAEPRRVQRRLGPERKLTRAASKSNSLPITNSFRLNPVVHWYSYSRCVSGLPAAPPVDQQKLASALTFANFIPKAS